MGSGKCRFCRLSSVGLGENRVLSPNKFGNHWVEQNHLDTSFYCQTSHGDDYATGCLGSLGGARLCGISQTYLSTEPFPGKAAVRFVFRRACLPTFRKLNGSQDHSVPSPPPPGAASFLPSHLPAQCGRGKLVASPGPGPISPMRQVARQPAAWCFMPLSCVRSCPLGRGCQRTNTQISRHTCRSGIMNNNPSDH